MFDILGLFDNRRGIDVRLDNIGGIIISGIILL